MHWNSDLNCFVDYEGTPLTKVEVREVVRLSNLHLGADPATLAKEATRVFAKRNPAMYRHTGDVSEETYY